MATGQRFPRRLGLRLLGALLGLQLVPAPAAAEPGPGIVDLPREQRLVVTLGPIELTGQTGLATHSVTAVAGGRISRAAMLYRFHVQLVDSAGRILRGGPAWSATLLAGSARDGAVALQPLMHLSARAHDVGLPKPLGYRVEAGDTLVLVAAIDDTPVDGRRLQLRLTIEYEPLDGPVSRLAVVPLQLNGSDIDGVSQPQAGGGSFVRSWEWSSDVSGRVLAFGGLPLEGASELLLLDATSGQMLWRTTPANEETGAESAQRSSFVRLGVAVQQGRIYRLDVVYEAPAAPTAPRAEAILAMVRPSRAPLTVAIAN